MERVLVLGATGMLGSLVYHFFRTQTPHTVLGTRRPTGGSRVGSPPSLLTFDAESDEEHLRDLLAAARPTLILNCLGVIKPFCRDDDSAGVRRAILVNALFPHRLARAAAAADARIIRIATDCVFSGRAGGYTENTPHDPLDVYGKTQSLGEVSAPHVLHLRCSIIGIDPPGRAVNLLSWFLAQPDGSTVPGYAHHLWNGVTTLQFAECCAAIVAGGERFFRQLRDSSPVLHFVPNAAVSKHELLQTAADVFGKNVRVGKVTDLGPPVDRTLATRFSLLPTAPGQITIRDALFFLRDYAAAMTAVPAAPPAFTDASA